MALQVNKTSSLRFIYWKIQFCICLENIKFEKTGDFKIWSSFFSKFDYFFSIRKNMIFLAKNPTCTTW